MCDATHCYIELASFAFHRMRSLKPQMSDLTDKGRLFLGNDDTILLVRKSVVIASAANGHACRPSRSSSTNLSFGQTVEYACMTRYSSRHLGVTRTLNKYLGTPIDGLVRKSALNGACNAASSVRYAKPLAKGFIGLYCPSPCPPAPPSQSALTTLGPGRTRSEEVSTYTTLRTASAVVLV